MTISSSESPQALTIEIGSIKFSSPDSFWVVAATQPSASQPSFTIVGELPFVEVGQCYRVEGRWRQHKTFGRQFQVVSATAVRPRAADGMVRYLSSGLIKGLGKKTAQRIVDCFGEDTFSVFDETPERLKTVPKVGKRQVTKIIRAWKERQDSAEVMMFLLSHGVGPATSRKIYELFGSDTLTELARDPYQLIYRVSGLGFLTVDRMAKALGVSQNSPQRIGAAVVYCLQCAEEAGHCYQTRDQVVLAAQKILASDQVEDADIDRSIEQLLGGGLVVDFPECGLSRLDLALAEASIAQSLIRIHSGTKRLWPGDDPELPFRVQSWLEKYTEHAGTSLSDDQCNALLAMAKSKVFILTGGPGVGKTTTANTAVRMFKAMRHKILLCAPTGRAAQRLSEVTGFDASTIHRLLEWSPQEGRFQRNEEKPLEADLVIVDEVSMIDVKLASHLFKAIGDSTQLVLIGDMNQLPAVGPGNVLSDLLASERVPFCNLTQVFRQAAESGIVHVAHDINQGEPPRLDQWQDCRFFEAQTSEQIIQQLERLVTDQLPGAGYDVLAQVQILTPMNRGEIGTYELNKTLQSWLNPDASSFPPYVRGNEKIKAGDKVIQTTNNYDLNVFNGDIGRVVSTHANDAVVSVDFSGRLVDFDDEQAGDLQLAYAISIHKSQGSEFPVVIIPVSMQHYVMLERNLFYTALTRAKRLAIFIGAAKALELASQRANNLKRQTTLRDRIRECDI